MIFKFSRNFTSWSRSFFISLSQFWFPIILISLLFRDLDLKSFFFFSLPLLEKSERHFFFTFHFSIVQNPLSLDTGYSIISAPLTICGSPFSLINDFIFRKNPFFSNMCVGYAAAVVIAGSEIMFISPSLRSGEIFHYFIYIYIFAHAF